MKQDMVKDGGKYNNELRNLQSFANEVLEKEKQRQRLKAMEAQLVDDIIEEDRKFKKALDELIKKYEIKIDLNALEEQRAKHAKKDLRKIKIEKRNKLIARIESQMADPPQPENSRYDQKASSQNS